MALTPIPTGRGAQVITDPSGDHKQAIRGAWANTFEENTEKMLVDIVAGIVAGGDTQDGSTRTGDDPLNYLVANAPVSGGGGGTVDEAPSNGTSYGRRNTTWAPVLPLAGGTMTGTLVLNTDPATPLQAATKQYVDAHAPTGFVRLTGDTMTGPLVLPGDPTTNPQAATKRYVDQGDANTAALVNTKVSKAGDTMTGLLVLSGDPATALGAATKQYADANSALRVLKAGDTMTGPLVLPAASPTLLTHATNKGYVDTQDGLRVARTGDTMTGPLLLPPGAPTLPAEATNKDYVDTAIANSQLNQGTWQVAANNPDLVAAIPTNLNGYTWTAQTVDPLVGELAPAGVTGIAGLTINAGDTIRWNSGLNAYEQIQGAGLTQAVADGRYVNTAGDTLTGALILAADPLSALEAATKQYTDAGDAANDAATALKVDKAGDVMTGILVLSGDPTANLDAAPKQYVDSVAATLQGMMVLKAGDTMQGALVLNANPSTALGAATKQYTDTADNQRVLKTGDTMTGALVLPGNPAAALDAVPKQYVDAGLALKVNLAGDTMSGPLVLAADPAADMEAANKLYVDEAVAAMALYKGVWQVAANAPDLDPAAMTPMNGWSWVAETVDPQVPETAPAGLPGIGGLSVDTGDRILWDAGNAIYDLVKGSSLSIQEARALFVDVSGDTMTGNLVVPGVQTDWIWPSTDGALQIRGDGVSGPGQKREIDLYASYTGPANYVRAEYFVDGASQAVDIGGVRVNNAGYANYNVFVGPRGGGQLLLRADDVAHWSVMPTGQLYAVTDNTIDIGNVGTYRPRDVHVGRNVRPDGVIDMLETATTPATRPTVGRLFLYPKDDGFFYTLDNAGTETQLGSGTGGGGLDQAAADLLYVKLAGGGVMTAGDITLFRAPSQPLHAATKNYVDTAVASQSLFQGNWKVATNVPDLRPVAMNPLNGWSWTAVTANPQLPETAPATIPGIAGQTIYNGDKITWNTALGVYERVQGSSLTGAQADALYVNVTGDAMTGALTLAADPVNPLEAATMQYAVARSGDTMSGLLLLSGDPVDDLGAATKLYVDTLSATAVQKTGDVMTGNLQLPLAPGPTNPEDATTKQYVDQSLAAANLYQGAWQVAANTPDLTAATPLNGYSWIAQTADPNIPEAAPAGLPGITAGTLIGAGTTIRWNGNSLAWELIQGGGLTQAVAGTLYIAKTGDTMAGQLTMGPAANLTFGTQVAANAGDNSKHIQLYSPAPTVGINVTSGRVNYNHNASGDSHFFRTGNADRVQINNAGLTVIGMHVQAQTDGYGIMMNAGGGIYKKVGGGVTIRQHANNTQPRIENNDGSNGRDILDRVNGGRQILSRQAATTDQGWRRVWTSGGTSYEYARFRVFGYNTGSNSHAACVIELMNCGGTNSLELRNTSRTWTSNNSWDKYPWDQLRFDGNNLDFNCNVTGAGGTNYAGGSFMYQIHSVAFECTGTLHPMDAAGATTGGRTLNIWAGDGALHNN